VALRLQPASQETRRHLEQVLQAKSAASKGR